MASPARTSPRPWRWATRSMSRRLAASSCWTMATSRCSCCRAGGALGRDQAEVGADRGAGEPVPVADFDGQPEPGQRRHPTQATQPPHHRGVVAVVGHLQDRLVQPVPPLAGHQHGFEVGVERQLRPGERQPLVAEPCLVPARPGRPAGVDDPLPQQQFRQPVPAAHQVTADVLPRPDQVPGGFLARRSAPAPRRSDPSATAGPDARHRGRRS